MRKAKKCSTTVKDGFITVNYNPNAPLEEKVDTLAECVSYLAKSILTMQKKVDDLTSDSSLYAEAISNLIDGLEDMQNGLEEIENELLDY